MTLIVFNNPIQLNMFDEVLELPQIERHYVGKYILLVYINPVIGVSLYIDNFQNMPNYVKVLYEGYSSNIVEQTGKSLPFVHANCSCVLVTGESTNVIVDTMTPWDGDRITESLKSCGLTPDDINYVISTHGHSDHLGNNNLFLKAKHIVGFCVSVGDQYFLHPFEEGVPFKIDEGIQVIATPGHTADDVSVVVQTKDLGTVVIAGDIFEREDDIEKPEIWRTAGSFNPEQQEKSRATLANIADFIVPGHGPMFRVTKDMKEKIIKACN